MLGVSYRASITVVLIALSPYAALSTPCSDLTAQAHVVGIEYVDYPTGCAVNYPTPVQDNFLTEV